MRIQMRRRTSGRTMAALGAVAALGFARGLRWSRRYKFEGKRVLVTGGSRGLGLEIARELAKRGARLILLARDAEVLARARDLLIEEEGAVVETIACDVSDPEVIDRVRAAGPIDVLINDAGTIQVGPVDAMREGDFRAAMATHFWGPLRLIEAVVPMMRARGGGRIVNISSIGGILAVPHLVPYSASKFALRGLSEGLRAELAKDDIVVTTVCPGLMRTGSPRNAIFKGDHRAEYAWFSISDALPPFAMSSRRAARRIVRACAYGEGHVILTAAAKLGALAEALAPGLMGKLMSLVTRALPRDTTPAAWFGWESTSAASPSALTALDEKAANRNNEVLS